MSGTFSHRFAHVILRCYPPVWRRRYADEMRALLLESHSSWRSVADLAIGAIREWVGPAQSSWPTGQALTRASLALMFGSWVGPLAIAWISEVVGTLVRLEARALPFSAEWAATMMWVAASLWLTTNVFRNAIAIFRGSPRVPVMLGRNVLLGLALLALVAGILESATREATSRSWLTDAMPYFRAIGLGGLACGQSARMARLARLTQAKARRLQRARLFSHVGPTLGLGGGGARA